MKYPIIITILLLISTTVNASTIVNTSTIPQKRSFTDQQAIKSIIGEAEDQGDKGMLLVACAIRNRGTLKGVYGLHAPRVRLHKYSTATYVSAKTAWELSSSEDGNYCGDIKGATNWENINAFGKPYWVSSMVETYRYRDHVFYK